MKKRIGKFNKKGNLYQDFAIKFLRMPKSKRSQYILGMSFGVIFSIILIVFFIVIAGIVIGSFLKTGDCARVGIFLDSFRSDVKRTWNSQVDSHVFKGNLPSKIDFVCFGNLSRSSSGEFQDIGFELGIFEGRNANMFFYPIGRACELPYHFINHLDIEKIAIANNPNCVSVDNGRVNINVAKGLNDRFVYVRI